MKDKIIKRITLLFGLIVLLLAGVTAVALRNLRLSTTSADWVNHTHAVIEEADTIISSLHAGEAALRNYLLTLEERDRNACRVAYANAAEHLELAKALTRSEAAQNAELLKIEPLIARRVDFARTVIKSRQEDGWEAVRKRIAADGEDTAEIQRRVGLLKDQEQVLLRARDQESYWQGQNTRWILFTGSVLHVLILLFLVYLLRDDIAARRRAASALEEANKKLDATVSERTRELAAANEALAAENLGQRWSNQALDHQLRYHQLIINSIDGLIFVISKALNISRINPAVTRQTGFELHELVGGPLHRALSPTLPGGPGEALKSIQIVACLKDGRDLTDSPAFLHRRDGQKTPVTFSVFPLRDRDKIVGGVVTVKCPEQPSTRLD